MYGTWYDLLNMNAVMGFRLFASLDHYIDRVGHSHHIMIMRSDFLGNRILALWHITEFFLKPLRICSIHKDMDMVSHHALPKGIH